MIGRFLGTSSTGTAHSLLIEHEPNGGMRFTVLGHDGAKRHAAVIVPATVATAIADAILHAENE